jgi:hypothetical protein
MNLESEPKINNMQETLSQPETLETISEKKDYELERLSCGWKALGAVDVGLLSTLKEATFTPEEEWDKREKETGGAGRWLLKNFGEKAIKGLKAMENIDELLDEANFGDIVDEYKEKIKAAKNKEEKANLRQELKDIKASRDKQLAEERKGHNLRNSIFKTFAKALK